MFNRTILTAVCALALMPSAANAADMYAPAPSYKDAPYVGVNWSGFYFGANGGYAWNSANDQLYDHFFGAGASTDGVSPNGAFGGGQIGYNWQGVLGPRTVIGAEADIQGAGISDSANWKVGATNVTTESRLDWFGTVRGRLGYSFGNALAYATGGLAYGSVHNSESGGTVYDVKRIATGYTVGAGIEYMVSPSWSVKGEYQYINLGKNDPVSANNVGLSSIANTKLEDDAYNTVRLGVNYHVGAGYMPLK